MINKINHIAFAARNIDKIATVFQKILGFTEMSKHKDHEQGIRVILMKSNNASIELMEPFQSDTPIDGFLKKHGQGFHHVSFEVENLDEILNEITQNGIKVINDKPLTVDKSRIAFLHPNSTGGILVELIQTIK